MGNGRAVIGVIVVIVGLAAIAAGVMYLAIPAHSLPSFMPGTKTGTGHHSKRGLAGVAVGVVLLIIGVAVFVTGRRRYRY